MSGEVNLRRSEFNPGGGRRECFLSVEAAAGAFPDFASELAAVWSAYRDAVAAAGMTASDELLLRFHLSDAANQGGILRRTLAGRSASVTEQPPAAGTRVSLEAWLVAGSPRPKCRVVYSPAVTEGNSEEQMYRLFGDLAVTVTAAGGKLERNVLRTWIYCRDVDNNYAGVVRGRNRRFDEHGMTERYLASTGIGGGAADPHQLVAMDALVCDGEAPEETPLRALENLSPTALYGVRFERGMRVGWRDRDWLIVSGTASIDKHGKVLHTGDVAKQSCRVLENISALLAEGGGALSDVRSATVYLRDPADLAAVKKEFDDAFPGIPLVYLRAPVCRPAWLVECECLAVRKSENPAAPEL